jgi:hypothetical protein
MSVRCHAELAVGKAFGDRQSPTFGEARKDGEQAAVIGVIRLRVGQAGPVLDPAAQPSGGGEVREDII